MSLFNQPYPWCVPPWGLGKVAQVMSLWLLAYILIGQALFPMALSLLGLDRDYLTLRGHAVLHLCLDLSQLGATILILWKCLSPFKPRSLGLFPIRFKGSWPLIVLVSTLLFPLIDSLAQKSLSWFPTDSDHLSSQIELSLSTGDWIANSAYLTVVSVCAPIWEEAIFRGFLLSSLSRFMPTRWSIVTSSVLFAMCHFRLQTFLPLLVLGILFSSVFVLTRNLLPPILLHSLWNLFVLGNLIKP